MYEHTHTWIYKKIYMRADRQAERVHSNANKEIFNGLSARKSPFCMKRKVVIKLLCWNRIYYFKILKISYTSTATKTSVVQNCRNASKIKNKRKSALTELLDRTKFYITSPHFCFCLSQQILFVIQHFQN